MKPCRLRGRPAGFGRAKACIFLFMWGGPSQLETFDPKPDAPAEIRGPFKPISTAVPGTFISEHFQRVARLTDRLAIIRSLSHDDPAHLSSGHVTLTGHLAPVMNSDGEPPSDRDTPHLGSVVARLRQADPATSRRSSHCRGWQCIRARTGRTRTGAKWWLAGSRYDPMLIAGDPIPPDGASMNYPWPTILRSPGSTAGKSLLAAIDQQRQIAEHRGRGQLDTFKQKAFGLLSSAAARQAFDLSVEPDAVRDRYGRNIHGQSVLLARRLVEHGVSLVSVNWHNDGRNFWDTHGNNFNRLKDDLIPPADQALSALLEDLDERGYWMRQSWPGWANLAASRRSAARQRGRDHWPRCYSGLLAGGGVRGGAVYGASDAQAAYPADLAASPQDFIATIYHALGIDPALKLMDRLGAPSRYARGGRFCGCSHRDIITAYCLTTCCAAV